MPALVLPTPGGAPPPPVIPEYAHRLVSAQLLDKDGSVVPGDPLLTAFGIMFYDEWDGPGYGTVSLALSETGSLELIPGRFVNCFVEDSVGTPQVRFTFMIEGNPQYSQIMRGEEYDQIVSVRGRGWTCIFDQAATFPEFDLKFSLETTWRLFSFASALFPNDGSWKEAIEQAEYLEGVTSANCYGHWQQAPDGNAYPAPIGWPWGTNPNNLVDGVPTPNYIPQYWLRTYNQPTYVSAGYYFFRRTFTLAAFSAVTFDVTADNFFTFFLEGVPITGENPAKADHWMWQGWKGKQLWLPAGTYTLGAVVYNVKFSDMGATPPYPDQPACPEEGWVGGPRDENAGGLLGAVYIAGDPVTPPVGILFTDENWNSHYEEEYWPGWTPDQIINQLISEGIVNDSLSVYNGRTSSAFLDSLGDEWRPQVTDYDRPDIPTFAVEVGTSLMAALQQMREIGWIHWHGQPGTFILDMYRGREPTPINSRTLTPGAGGNLSGLERAATSSYANALLVQWEGGYVVVRDEPAIILMETAVWGMYSSDAGSEDEAILQGENELLRMAQEQFPSVVATVEPLVTLDVPYEGYGLGSYLEAPAVGGGTELIRCLSIRCQQGPLGFAEWKMELNAKIDVPERRATQLLQQIGGRNQVIRGAVSP